MHLLRIQLPDRPGSLGVVATAMGTEGADIAAIEIVEQRDGWVVDDFIVSVPQGLLIESIVGACTELEGVRVLWVSRNQETWGLQGDVSLLNRMLDEPARASEILVNGACAVFHTQWTAVISRDDAKVLLSSSVGPQEGVELSSIGPLDAARCDEMPANWLPHWQETPVAICPLDEERTVVLGRSGGPVFLDSELRRLEHLLALTRPAVGPEE
ncbi:amino acid-binding protein [Luteococcus sp. Sow4_B9]|uniref:amino acid-binding protein n=1 Tax=Luteococcus sp. Sow4_B9 TaxID=3438792 RepID=UPI003F9743C3